MWGHLRAGQLALQHGESQRVERVDGCDLVASGFLLFLCDADAETRARGQGQTWVGRQRRSEAHSQQMLVSQGAALGPDQAMRDQDLNLSHEGCGGQSRAPHQDLGPQRPLSEGLDSFREKLSYPTALTAR